MNKTISLEELTHLVNGTLIGDSQNIVDSISEPEESTSSSIVFIKKAKYTLSDIKAGVIISQLDIHPDDKNFIKVKNIDVAFAQVLDYFDDKLELTPSIHTSASIASSAQLGTDIIIEENVIIREDVVVGDGSILHPNVYLGRNVVLGKNVILYPNVVIHKNTHIGNNVIIKSNSTIGSRGFGYYTKDKKNYPIPQIGIVRIDDDVDIGANVTIDRATIGETYIGKNVKIDNLVQIGHNVKIGDGTFVVAQVGISGSVTIGKNVILAGQVGLADHVTIGDNVFIGAKSGVPGNIKSNSMVFGMPARPLLKQRRIEGIISDLPELYKKIKLLEKKISNLEGENNE